MKIEVEGVVKAFGTNRALDGATLTVPAGAVYGLVGPNGAGKSTLIRHLAGIYRPDAGRIALDGQDPFDNAAIKGRVLCVHDEIFHYLHASTKDLKKLYARLYPAFDEGRYRALGQAFADLDEAVPVRRLSRGLQKQSALWLALSCRPDAILLDEPLDGLDPVMRRQVWSLLASDVAERRTTVLLSSHNLRELEDICDHVGVLNKGRVLLSKPLAALQGSVVKLQVLFDGDPPAAPERPDGSEAPRDAGCAAALRGRGLDVLHESHSGRICTFIVRGGAEDVLDRVAGLSPLYSEVLPLGLEETFVYELGGAGYAVRDILL